MCKCDSTENEELIRISKNKYNNNKNNDKAI